MGRELGGEGEELGQRREGGRRWNRKSKYRKLKHVFTRAWECFDVFAGLEVLECIHECLYTCECVCSLLYKIVPLIINSTYQLKKCCSNLRHQQETYLLIQLYNQMPKTELKLPAYFTFRRRLSPSVCPKDRPLPTPEAPGEKSNTETPKI